MLNTPGLKLTHDRKTANVGRNDKSVIKNAFSLPAGLSCPGMTDYCNSICYAGKLEKLYPSFRALVTHNFELLRNASFDDMVTMLDDVVTSFIAECDKRNADKLFRIHADGDFFNATYARAWSVVIQKHADVQFWAYTRVLSALHMLSDIDNLALYFSADPDNQNLISIARGYGVKIATVADTFDDARDINKAGKCPSNAKRIPLITDKGACASCQLCVYGKVDINFSKGGK